MSGIDLLLDTNILIYHTQGALQASNLVIELLSRRSFNISVLTKIEFLGWDRHSPEGFEKCRKLIETATVYSIDEKIAEQAIEIRRRQKVKLADAVIAATALSHGLTLATRNIDDFKQIEGLALIDPFV